MSVRVLPISMISSGESELGFYSCSLCRSSTVMPVSLSYRRALATLSPEPYSLDDSLDVGPNKTDICEAHMDPPTSVTPVPLPTQEINPERLFGRTYSD